MRWIIVARTAPEKGPIQKIQWLGNNPVITEGPRDLAGLTLHPVYGMAKTWHRETVKPTINGGLLGKLKIHLFKKPQNP